MPGSGVRAAFVAADGTASLRRDWRAPNESGHTWTLDVHSEAVGQELVLDVRIEGDVPGEFEVAILDDDARTLVSMPRPAAGAPGPWSARLALLGHGRERAVRLRVVAGTPEYVASAEDGTVTAVPPARLVLEQNAPNPFNATTRLRFGLPHAGRAQLDVFDVRGRLVVRLWDGRREAGWHSILWNGRDDTGHAVASGVYIARLRTDEGSVTRRLVAIE